MAVCQLIGAWIASLMLISLQIKPVGSSAEFPQLIGSGGRFELYQSKESTMLYHQASQHSSPFILTVEPNLHWVLWLDFLTNPAELLGRQYSSVTGTFIPTGKTLTYNSGKRVSLWNLLKAVPLEVSESPARFAVLTNGGREDNLRVTTFDIDGVFLESKNIDQIPTVDLHGDMEVWTDKNDGTQYLVVSYFSSSLSRALSLQLIKASALRESYPALVKELTSPNFFYFSYNYGGPAITKISDNKFILSFVEGPTSSSNGKARIITINAPESIDFGSDVDLGPILRVRTKSINNGRNVLVVGHSADSTQFQLDVYDSNLEHVCARHQGSMSYALVDFTEVRISSLPGQSHILMGARHPQPSGNTRPDSEMYFFQIPDFTSCASTTSLDPLISVMSPGLSFLRLRVFGGVPFSDDGRFAMFEDRGRSGSLLFEFKINTMHYPLPIQSNSEFQVSQYEQIGSGNDIGRSSFSPLALTIGSSITWVFWANKRDFPNELNGQQYTLSDSGEFTTTSNSLTKHFGSGIFDLKIMAASALESSNPSDPAFALLSNDGVHSNKAILRVSTFDSNGGSLQTKEIEQNGEFGEHGDMAVWTDDGGNQYLIVSYFSSTDISIKIFLAADLTEIHNQQMKSLSGSDTFDSENNIRGPSIIQMNDNQFILSLVEGSRAAPESKALFFTIDAPDSVTIGSERPLSSVSRVRMMSINNGQNIMVVGQSADNTQYQLAVYDSTLQNICVQSEGPMSDAIFDITAVNSDGLGNDPMFVISARHLRYFENVRPTPELYLFQVSNTDRCSESSKIEPLASWVTPVVDESDRTRVWGGVPISDNGRILLFYDSFVTDEFFHLHYQINEHFTPQNAWNAPGWSQSQSIPFKLISKQSRSPVVLKDESNKYWVIWQNQDGSRLMGQRYDASNHELDSTVSIDYSIQVSSVLSAIYIESDSKLAILSTHQGRMTLSLFGSDGMFQLEHLIVDNPLFPEHGHLITLTAANNQEYLAVSYFDEHRIKLAVFDTADLSAEPERMDLSSGSGVSFDPNRNLRGPKMVALGDQGLFAVSWFEMRNLREKSSVAIFQLSDASTLQIKSIRNMGRWVNPTLTSLSDDLIAVINNDKHNLLSDDQYSLNLFRVSNDGELTQCGEPTIHSTGRMSMWNRVSTLWTVQPDTIPDTLLFASHRSPDPEDSFTQVWKITQTTDGNCFVSTDPGMGWSLNIQGSSHSAVFEGIQLNAEGDFLVPFEDHLSEDVTQVASVVYRLEHEN